MSHRWVLPERSDRACALALSREFGIPILVASLLVARGFGARGEADEFLNPRLKRLADPFELPEMALAVERLQSALFRRERIVLYGDYDVDGVTSLALLHRVLSAYGGIVRCFLPLRATEGYGLSRDGIERCFEEFCPQLLVAVDCGTNSIQEIASIAARSVDVIVLDHHEPGAGRPACCALVNPKTDGGKFGYLCSAGIAFKTAHGLLKREPLPGFDLKSVLDLVALATVCDLVPLSGENRILVSKGLDQMAASCWAGVKALIDVAGIERPVRTADVGFRLGPRLNAAGRLGAAREALELLLSNDAADARRLAGSLDAQNRERQAVEKAVVGEVEAWIESYFDPSRHASIVAGRRDWHVGVLGIVASRVTRKHHRPSLVIGFDQSGAGKGSGRSIEGLSLVDALSRCGAYLEKFGGHEMAAGLSLHEERFADFREAFEAAARSMVRQEMLVPRLRLDAEIGLYDFGDSLIEAQHRLEPFGASNPQPTLLMRGVAPCAAPVVLKGKHLQLSLGPVRRRIRAIFFNGAERGLPSPPWDVAFHVERNHFNGRSYPQMHIVDIRAAT